MATKLFTMVNEAEPFWERSEQVETFAGRDPDRRLLDLIEGYSDPAATRVLDLGCAAGRNAALLAERGFDVHALDASSAMVERTRERLAGVLGAEEAGRRVSHGRMEDLGLFAANSFQLVVALGVYQSATSRAQWDRALEETARVLAPGGLLLVANFSPGSKPSCEGLRRVEGERNLYEGHEAGPLFLLEADELDAEMLQHRLVPVTASETVVRRTETGCRVTVNGLYQRRSA